MISLKILRVSSDLYPSVIGGVGLHAHEMSKEQSKLGHKVMLYTASIDSNFGFSYNYGIRRFKPIIKIFGNSIVPNMFLELIKNKHKYDVIHAHSHLCFSTNLCAFLRNIGSSPLVVTTHGGLNSQSAPSWVQKIYTLTGAKFTFASADKIICYTDVEREEMINLGVNSEKIAVIHNGIDTDMFIPSRDRVYSEKKKLLWIGRYVPGKGVEYLIDAFKLLKSKYPDISLTMVGRGPQKDQIIRKIINLNLNDSIIIKDYIPNSKIVTLYHNSDILVLPSLGEGVPRVIMEAMSCGLPVVCTKLPQLVNLVDGCGFLVPLKDPTTMAEKISEILSNETLARKFGESGRKRVVDNYSWSDTIKKTIKLYEELI